MIVYTASGTALELVEPPLGRGGEGAVYRLASFPKRVAKIYTSDAESHRSKIEAMASLADAVAARPALADVAWPMAALYADSKARRFVGFGMRAVDAAFGMDELHEYPAPSGVRVSMREKVDYLIGLASVTEELHSLGQVIGDFNDNNLSMTKRGRKVAVVDVDSFHATIGGRTYRCEVCMSGYAAPELIRTVRGTTFRDCPGPTFTKETDRFSLAVHVFRMLFNGAHPYHCASVPGPRGSVRAPLPLEKRVEQGSTPFFKNVPGAKVPPFAPSVSEFPDYLQELFRRAFVEGQTDPARRPTAAQWARALTRYCGDLVQCKACGLHWHAAGASGCPYCAADARAAGVTGLAGVAASIRMRGTGRRLPGGAAAGKAQGGGAVTGKTQVGSGAVKGKRTSPGTVGALSGGSGGISRGPGSAFSRLGAGGGASAAASRKRGPGRRPGSAARKARRAAFWVLSLLLSGAVFCLCAYDLPLCEAVSELMVGTFGGADEAIYLSGALVGTIVYNLRHPRATSGTQVVASGFSAIPGMLAASVAQLLLYIGPAAALVALVVAPIALALRSLAKRMA